MPKDFLQWDPTCHHDDPRLMELADSFCDISAQCFFGPQLFYLWGHAYKFDGNHNWDVIERFLDCGAPLQGKIWFATNGEIVNYTEAYRRLVWSADGSTVTNLGALPVWVGIGREGAAGVPASGTVKR